EIGERCSWVAGDIREPAQARALVQAALERHGRLDLLLNNAGGQYFVPAEAITAKGWNAVQRLNVGGTLAMCNAAYELAMRPAGGGTIVNTTVSPHHGMPAMAHTGSARAAVEAFTIELAGAWRSDGVALIAVALGRLATESLRKYPAELWRRAAASVPLQRLGEVEEYGWLVALLASPLGPALSGSGRGRLRTLPPTARCRPRSAGRPAEPGRPGYHRRYLRAKCCGCTEAFQASRAGSIPVARSADGSHWGDIDR